MNRVRASYAVVVALVAGLALLLPASVAEARAPWSCRLAGTGMQDYLWSGAQDGRWGDGANWRGGSAPVSATDSYVCIKQAVTVTLGPDSGRVDLGAFELGNGTTLLVEPGTELYVNGQTSLARAGSLIVLRGSTLGGTGTIIERGTLRMQPADGVPARLATGLTAGIALFQIPQLLVDDQGRVEVTGDGPSLLTDLYTVQVRGWVGIGGGGGHGASLAADHGTSFELAPAARRDGAGTLELLNDQGFSEGAGDPLLPLATFVNGGVINKTGGTGVSRIAADYSSRDGSVVVGQGSLMLPDGTFAQALVGPGATYGTGTCDASSADCGNGTSAERPQTASLTVPARADGLAQVVVTQVDDDVSKVLGTPVKAHASGGVASRTAPYVIELRYDASLLDGRTWKDLQVRHKDGGRTYDVVPTCLKTGAIPPTSDACVDRSGNPDSSRALTGDSAGDVVMVVRTIRTSRWIAY